MTVYILMELSPGSMVNMVNDVNHAVYESFGRAIVAANRLVNSANTEYEARHYAPFYTEGDPVSNALVIYYPKDKSESVFVIEEQEVQ